MLKAFRYLKPYWISVVAVIVLVFAQVQAQLALPDHMSLLCARHRHHTSS